MDFKEFKNKLKLSTKQAFTEVYKQNPKEEIYAFALCNNDSTIAIHPSSNSSEYLNDILDEDDFLYYKYEPSEWKFEHQGASKSFEEINLMCKAVADEHDNDEDWFYNFQNQINEKCIEVLEDLKNENFFRDEAGKEIFLNFSVIDDDINSEKQSEVISQLNNNEFKDDYFDWMKSWKKKRAL